MKKLLAISAIAGALFAAGVADANAGSRSGSISGPRGTTTFSGSRSCAGGVCSSQGSVTGPYGGTISHQGSSTCSGGTCSGSGVVTGPPRRHGLVQQDDLTLTRRSGWRRQSPSPAADIARGYGSWINSQACSVSTPA